jgi:hypothetical protein
MVQPQLAARGDAFEVLGSTYLTISLTCNGGVQQAKRRPPLHLYLALDNSGSMAGAALSDAKAAAAEFLEQAAALELASLHLLVFNCHTTDVDLTGDLGDLGVMRSKASRPGWLASVAGSHGPACDHGQPP